MLKDLLTAKSRVKELLEKYEQTRDSDKLLWLAYLCNYHNLKISLGEESYRKLKNIVLNENTPTMESIRRVRQKFQENGLYIGKLRSKKLDESDVVKEWSLFGDHL